MDTRSFVQTRVKNLYWDKDLNCATTNILILSEKFEIKLSNQVLDSAIGMHGAGKYGAQCGLVEGTLMFLGIIGKFKNIPENEIVSSCKMFAAEFEKKFSSLSCSFLRPEGFSEKNPPHLCEKLTCEAICFSIDFVERFIGRFI